MRISRPIVPRCLEWNTEDAVNGKLQSTIQHIHARHSSQSDPTTHGPSLHDKDGKCHYKCEDELFSPDPSQELERRNDGWNPRFGGHFFLLCRSRVEDLQFHRGYRRRRPWVTRGVYLQRVHSRRKTWLVPSWELASPPGVTPGTN